MFGSSSETRPGYLISKERTDANKDVRTIEKLFFLSFEDYPGSITIRKVLRIPLQMRGEISRKGPGQPEFQVLKSYFSFFQTVNRLTLKISHLTDKFAPKSLVRLHKTLKNLYIFLHFHCIMYLIQIVSDSALFFNFRCYSLFFSQQTCQSWCLTGFFTTF